MSPENKPLLHRAKQFVLHIMRAIGMFRVARWLTADKIRILCYHGISLNDEHRFRPALFMRPETFADRIEHLAIKGYPVISLDAACDLLERGGAENCAVVITIDDGWYGTYKHMLPILRRHAMPATLYVSTYYVQNQVQVFNVAVQYLIWSARRQPVELSGGPAQITDRFDLSMVAERERLFEALPVDADHDSELVRTAFAIDQRAVFMRGQQERGKSEPARRAVLPADNDERRTPFDLGFDPRESHQIAEA